MAFAHRITPPQLSSDPIIVSLSPPNNRPYVPNFWGRADMALGNYLLCGASDHHAARQLLYRQKSLGPPLGISRL